MRHIVVLLAAASLASVSYATDLPASSVLTTRLATAVTLANTPRSVTFGVSAAHLPSRQAVAGLEGCLVTGSLAPQVVDGASGLRRAVLTPATLSCQGREWPLEALAIGGNGLPVLLQYGETNPLVLDAGFPVYFAVSRDVTMD